MAERTAAILLLVSEPVVRTVLTEALERAGYVVRPTGDVGSAVELLNSSPVDLLMIRTYVEGMPGHQAAKYLLGKHPAMATLMVTGLPDDDRIQIPADLQQFVIFPPPFSLDDLVKQVDALLERHKNRTPKR
jgi:DNA-binding NtrC family response regulator